jgi:hypothetical protein
MINYIKRKLILISLMFTCPKILMFCLFYSLYMGLYCNGYIVNKYKCLWNVARVIVIANTKHNIYIYKVKFKYIFCKQFTHVKLVILRRRCVNININIKIIFIGILGEKIFFFFFES